MLSAIYIFRAMSKQTRRKRLKSALYLRLKKREVFQICPGRIHEKLWKQFRDTQSVPFMLDMTGKSLFPTGNKKNWKFFSKKNFENVA